MGFGWSCIHFGVVGVRYLMLGMEYVGIIVIIITTNQTH